MPLHHPAGAIRRTGAEIPIAASLEEDNLADLAWREGDMAGAAAHGRRAPRWARRCRPVIEKILAHLELDPQPPPNGRAREALHFAA